MRDSAGLQEFARDYVLWLYLKLSIDSSMERLAGNLVEDLQGSVQLTCGQPTWPASHMPPIPCCITCGWVFVSVYPLFHRIDVTVYHIGIRILSGWTLRHSRPLQ